MEQPLISVIIPVYKVYDYVNKCIESIVVQTYSNLQIILIDDGSPDDCAIRCDEWTKKDDRITVIHKLNGGQADARNFGLRIAGGEYISFIDSDDYISKAFIDVLLSAALEHNSDITVCDYAKFYDGGKAEVFHDDFVVSDYTTINGISALIDENPFRLHVWDKIYRRKAIENIFFESGKIHEDVFWLFQAFGHSEKITKINQTMYYYLQRNTSTIGQGYSLRSLDYLEEKWKSRLYIEKNYPELDLKAKLNFFGSCIYLCQCVLKYMSGEEKRQAVAAIRKYKKKCRITFSEIKTVRKGVRKYYYLAKINIYLCSKLRAELNIGF